VSDLPATPKASFLELKLATADAVYQKFGRDGLRERPVEDAVLLLNARKLELRDAPKGNVSEEQKAKNRSLELQVADLTAFVNGRAAEAGLPASMDRLRQAAEQRAQFAPQRGKDQDRDRGR
jgi:hypothetical protein